MECRQVVSLIDKYIEGNLEKQAKLQLERHVRNCMQCENELLDKMNLFRLLERDSKICLPDSFTDQIMSAIHQMEMPIRHRVASAAKYNYCAVFRRLGISMVVSAAVMLLSMSLPGYYWSTAEQFAIEKTSELSEKTISISTTFDQLNNRMKNFFNKINNSIEKYKEGY